LYVVLLVISLALALVLYRERTTEVQAEDSVILGKVELIELSAWEGGETKEVLAKIDTGAGYSSMDRDVAEDLGIDLDDPEDEVEIESANGGEKRPLVRARIRMAGRTLDTRVSVTPTAASSRRCCRRHPGPRRVFDQAERSAANLSEWSETVAPRMRPFSGG
jgi:hypothetical protein